MIIKKIILLKWKSASMTHSLQELVAKINKIKGRQTRQAHKLVVMA